MPLPLFWSTAAAARFIQTTEITMENGTYPTPANEGGFKAMSQHAETGSGTEENAEGGPRMEKSIGVDTEQMTEVASERVSELQELIMDEIRARPLRALGWAAAAGVVFGFWAAK